MKVRYYPNETIDVITPNGIKIEATIVRKIAHEVTKHGEVDFKCDTYLCYAQNRLFTYVVEEDHGVVDEHYEQSVCDYCIIPKYEH